MSVDHTYRATVRDMIAQEVGRIRRATEHLRFLVTEYPDCATPKHLEFFQKLEPILEKENGRDC